MLNRVMNDTKWDELRLAMHALDPTPAWSALSTNGYRYGPDYKWLHHFRIGGYKDIVHVDIHGMSITDQPTSDNVGAEHRLRQIPSGCLFNVREVERAVKSRNKWGLACCRFRGHRVKVFPMKLERMNATKEVQPRVQA
ncbi:DUF6678 family protein [Neorhizobium huautlense]|uniref:DUF6678 family protein n=1 Tax=Neorhizobium huautlense TaxID=67774 RepID=UPI00315A97DA